ncbi:MAG: hypothetical protein ACREMK_16030 [Gemmatimonadota bacterium]
MLTVVTLDALEISDSATVIALLLLPLLVFGVVSGKIQEFTGPGGWGARFAELKRQQDIQASDIESIRVALRGLVSKYELEHLRRLRDNNLPFIVNYGKEFYGEIKRLDDFGFILPKPDLPSGLYTLVERFGHEVEAPLGSRTKFNLHDYVVLTQEGRRYLDLYDATTP